MSWDLNDFDEVDDVETKEVLIKFDDYKIENNKLELLVNYDDWKKKTKEIFTTDLPRNESWNYWIEVTNRKNWEIKFYKLESVGKENENGTTKIVFDEIKNSKDINRDEDAYILRMWEKDKLLTWTGFDQEKTKLNKINKNKNNERER